MRSPPTIDRMMFSELRYMLEMRQDTMRVWFRPERQLAIDTSVGVQAEDCLSSRLRRVRFQFCCISFADTSSILLVWMNCHWKSIYRFHVLSLQQCRLGNVLLYHHPTVHLNFLLNVLAWHATKFAVELENKVSAVFHPCLPRRPAWLETRYRLVVGSIDECI
jgi:hypothetical protein